MCPKDFYPTGTVRETADSKRGKYYLAANNTKIAVKGRKTVEGYTKCGKQMLLEAEVAEQIHAQILKLSENDRNSF